MLKRENAYLLKTIEEIYKSSSSVEHASSECTKRIKRRVQVIDEWVAGIESRGD